MATQPRAEVFEELHVGQKVIARSNRWTPDGWEPVEEIATVIDPCVKNDPDYAGDVELSIEGALNRVFVPRATIDPIALPMSEREAALRDVIAMADHLRGLATDTTPTGRAQRRMATRIIQAIEAEIARGE